MRIAATVVMLSVRATAATLKEATATRAVAATITVAVAGSRNVRDKGREDNRKVRASRVRDNHVISSGNGKKRPYKNAGCAG